MLLLAHLCTLKVVRSFFTAWGTFLAPDQSLDMLYFKLMNYEYVYIFKIYL